MAVNFSNNYRLSILLESRQLNVCISWPTGIFSHLVLAACLLCVLSSDWFIVSLFLFGLANWFGLPNQSRKQVLVDGEFQSV